MFKAINQTAVVHHFLNRYVNARHITGTVIGIMTDLQRLAITAKHDFLLCKYAWKSNAMYTEAVIIAATCAFNDFFLIRVALTKLLANLGDQFGRFDRSARRGIQLL